MVDNEFLEVLAKDDIFFCDVLLEVEILVEVVNRIVRDANVTFVFRWTDGVMVNIVIKEELDIPDSEILVGVIEEAIIWIINII